MHVPPLQSSHSLGPVDSNLLSPVHIAPASPALSQPASRPVSGSDPQTKTATARVLHIINGEHYSGAERVQDLLAERLLEFGYEVVFACVKPDRFPERRQTRAARLYETPMRSRWDWRVVRQVVEIARHEDCRVIHAHTPRSALVGRLVSQRTGLPLVYHVHSPTARDSTQRIQNRLNDWIERWSIGRASALIAVSRSLREYMLRRGYAPDQCIAVPNGVPAAAVVRSSTPPGETWTLGMAALFRPRKGLEVLLHALQMLRRNGAAVRLRAVGDFETPEYRTAILRLADSLEISDAITWTGFSSNVGAELVQMDLFVLPSLFGEGLPMVVLEAMAAGVPVVATRVEGVPEAVEHGVEGVLAQPNDSVSLAKGIRSIMDGQYDWSLIRERALRRHAAEFSDRRMAERVAEIYRQVANAD